MVKPQNLTEEDWDICIILDACRFDVFQEVYSEYLEGELEKRESPASNTGEWLPKVFTEEYDYTYISANPYVNSQGLPLEKCHEGYDSDWTATEHFQEIIDAWNIGWDDEIGTVLPEEMNRIYLRERPEHPVIIHYVQPHIPYISMAQSGVWRGIRGSIGQGEGSVGDFNPSPENRFMGGIRNRVGRFLDNNVKKETTWKVRRLLGAEPLTPFEKIWRESGGKEGVMEYYEDNLRKALEAVSNLVRKMDGDIVITADHGEALGEQEIWEHPANTRIPSLVEVPWFRVQESLNKPSKGMMDEIKQSVRGTLDEEGGE